MRADESLSVELYSRWIREAGFEQLRQLLFWLWDPIGVNDAFPDTADEYDAYVRTLLSRLRQGMTADDVAAYLLEVERGPMGLAVGHAAPRRDVAERVVDWFEASVGHWLDRRA